MASAALLLIGLTVAACAQSSADFRTVASRPYHGIPVPANARLINEGRSLALPAKSWGAAYASDMSMKQAAGWYEAKLKAAGWKFEKAPEKPEAAGYTIFNMSRPGSQVKVVVVNDSNKGGTNIQVSGGPAD